MKKVFTIVLAAVMLTGCMKVDAPSNSTKPDFTSVPNSDPTSVTSQPTSEPTAPTTQTGEYNAMWISYLEWKNFNTENEAAFTASVAQVADNCQKIGVNRLIVQVRPFADAIYPSKYFVQSHIITGTQGQDVGFDAFAVFVAEAKKRNMQIEAWINPYRIRLNKNTPENLSPNGLYSTHPQWVKEVNGGLYLEPSNKDVMQYIVDGVKEVVENYDIDGVQFDDYFYPTTEASFDEQEYKALGGGLPLDEWRRQNVNTLIKSVYSAIKEVDPNCIFGISPQGNNDNNYNQQYSDVSLWLKEKGYADYIMPQLYWGFDYLTKSGNEKYQFANLTKEWAAYPRHEEVKLLIGLGAWRIGAGDGGANDQAEWQKGRNLADMIETCNNTEGISGYALYRYDSLFNNPDFADLSASEVVALAK